MFYSYKNVPVVIDNSNFLVSNVSLQVNNQSAPTYQVGDRYSFDRAPTDSVGSVINLSYFITGKDSIKTRFIEDRGLDLTENLITGNVGGLFFRSGYLSSYSINGQPNSDIQANAQIVVYDDLLGSVAPVTSTSEQIKPLNMSDCSLTIFNTDATNFTKISNFSYDYTSEAAPVYTISSVNDYENLKPESVRYGEKRIALSLITNDGSGNLKIKGEKIAVKIGFNNSNAEEQDYLYVSGDLLSKNASVATNGLFTNALSVEQHYIQQKPLISGTSALVGDLGTLISIDGQNIYPTIGVYFGDKKSDYVVPNGFNSIKAKIPRTATAGKITVKTFGGEDTWPLTFVPNDGGIQVDPITNRIGAFGESLVISGNNFYAIDNVYFDQTPSAFKVVDTNTIVAEVPSGFTQGAVTVQSLTRTISGASLNTYLKKPKITTFIPQSGVESDTISVSGLHFTGLHRVTFNGIEAGFSTISNNTIQATVPSGNTHGRIVVEESGSLVAESPFNFKTSVYFTNVTPSSGRAGELVTISGSNFYPALFKQINSGKVQVDFNGGITGFTIVDTSTMTGLVPSGAATGPVKFASFQQTVDYGSPLNFIRRYPSPTIAASRLTSYNTPIVAIKPSSTIRSGDPEKIGAFNIEGVNLFDIQKVKLSGVAPHTGAYYEIQNIVTGGYYVPNPLAPSQFTSFTGLDIKTDILGTKVQCYFPLNISGGESDATKPYVDYAITIEANEGTVSGDTYTRLRHYDYYPI